MAETNQNFKHPEHFNKLSKSIQKWIKEKKWPEFWPIQLYAIDTILATEKKEKNNDLILFAPTAGGKTMAAFLPLLTELENSESKKMGYEILYISPTKALISQHSEKSNDVVTLAKKIDRKVTPWMGDVSQSVKNRSWDSPNGSGGILMITPESLEARFVKRPYDIPSRFAALRAVIIDELHVYFESPRGSQLISLLTRLDEALGGPVQRVALSATLGSGSVEDWKKIHTFLRPGFHEERRSGLVKENPAVDPENSGHGFKYKININTYFNDDFTDTNYDTRDKIACDIHGIFKGRRKTGLVFTNSRREAEWFTYLLNENRKKGDQSSENKLENGHTEPAKTKPERTIDKFLENKTPPDNYRKYWPHHGSLAQSLRAEAEKRMRSKNKSCVLVATTTLELGIDVGRIEEVVQIGPGYSVSSLRQRMGRSGRPTFRIKEGKPILKSKIPKLHVYIREHNANEQSHIIHQLHLPIFQAVAQVSLLREGKFEAPDLEKLHLSTFVQQLLSLIHQHREQGLTKEDAFRILVGHGPFNRLSQPLTEAHSQNGGMSVFDAVIERLRTRIPPLIDLDLEYGTTSAELFLTPAGEKVINSNEIYAAFRTPVEYTIKSASNILGTVGLAVNYGTGDRILYSGRAWEITGIDHRRRNIEVRPASTGRAAYFTGDALNPSEEVVGRMKQLYEMKSREFKSHIKKIAVPCETTRTMLEKGRAVYQSNNLGSLPILKIGGGQKNKYVSEKASDIFWLPWVGDKTLKGLAAALRWARVPASPFRMSIFIQDRTTDDLKKAIEVLKNEFPAMDDLARRSGSTSVEKFDHYLSPILWRKEIVSSRLGEKEKILEKLKELDKSL